MKYNKSNKLILFKNKLGNITGATNLQGFLTKKASYMQHNSLNKFLIDVEPSAKAKYYRASKKPCCGKK